MELQEKLDNLDKRLTRQSRLLALTSGLLLLTIAFLITRWVLDSAGFVGVFPKVIMTERTEGGTTGFLQAVGKHTRLHLSEILWTEEAPKKSFTSQPRAQLIADDEQTGLLLYDRSGQVRVQLVVTEDQPKLVLLDKNGDAVFSAP